MESNDNKKIGGPYRSVAPRIGLTIVHTGEFGDIRANIDVERLEAYLSKNLDGLILPLDVKQFKVCYV